MTKVPELWGMTEVCVNLNLSRARVHQFRNQGVPHMEAFPEPVAVLACGPIWLAHQVKSWDAKRPKVGGPRPKVA
jgi:hypothetical protein